MPRSSRPQRPGASRRSPSPRKPSAPRGRSGARTSNVAPPTRRPRRSQPALPQGRAFASIAPGFERWLVEELTGLGIDAREAEGGATFHGTPDQLDRALRGSRLAGRITLQVGTAPANSLDGLAQAVRKLPWAAFARNRQPIDVDVQSRGSRLRRKDVVAKKVAHAIQDTLRGPTTERDRRQGTAAPLKVRVRILGDQAILAVDAGGDLLHRRGWRRDTVAAPMRETLAAAVLRIAGWTPDTPLVDPLCGSGTFSIEAAQWAKGISPGAQREFAAHGWPCWKPRDPAVVPPSRIAGIYTSDRYADAVTAAGRNARRADVSDVVRPFQADFFDLEPPADTGLIVANPPYGQRLGSEGDVTRLYTRFGSALRDGWVGWKVAWLAPTRTLLSRVDGHLEPIDRMAHGGQRIWLGVGTIGG